MVTAAVIGGGASIVGGLIGAGASRSAAREQAAATRYAADQQRQMFDIQNAQWAPYRGVGYQGLNTLGSLMPGVNPVYDAQGNVIGQKEGSGYLTQQFGPEEFKANLDPSYAFLRDQGIGALSQKFGVGGGGSNIGIARTKFAEDYANTAFSNAYDRFRTQRQDLMTNLMNIANIGTGAQTNVSNLASGTASNIGQLGVAGSNAMAGGYLGAANAITGGLNSVANTAMQYGMYKPQTPGTTTTPTPSYNPNMVYGFNKPLTLTGQ
jgi:hypothetical protein